MLRPYNEDRLANSVATDNSNGNTYPQTVDYEANGNIKYKSDVGDYIYDPNKYTQLYKLIIYKETR